MKKKTTHQIIILQELLNGNSVTSIDAIASNRNQYFKHIKKQGIELIEVWRPNINNSGRHKERSLHQTIKNIEKAKKYLLRLKGSVI